ncbi:MAG: hypothetical protein K6G65_00280 [Lachnospiraceae bacterium]|nr:hypothetical protein [Lachnospiraceae bacterium]
MNMKRLNMTIVSILAFSIMLGVIPVKAADRELEKVAGRTKLEFSNANAGGEVTTLSSGSSNKNISNMDEWLESGRNVSISASMDGKTQRPLYWSDETYKYQKGKDEHIAVLKANEGHPWSEESCMIFKIEDINAMVAGITLEMGASEKGPRDYRIYYSVDEGANWKEMNSYGESTATVTASGEITTIFKKRINNSERTYITMNLTEKDGYCWNCSIYDDIYVKVVVDSDYKLNGETGLYGSFEGEWAIRGVTLLEHVLKIPEESEEFLSMPPKMEGYKTARNTITVTIKDKKKVAGYEFYLKNENGTYKKVPARRVTALKYEIRNLSAKKKYYIKARSYRTKEGETIYGSFSTKPVKVNMKKQPLPENISVNKKLSLKVGTTKTLKLKFLSGTSSRYVKSITYKAKNKKIVTVKKGKVKGKKKGNAVITTRVLLKSGLSKTFHTKVKVR